jgi:hypothetical protein
MNYLRKVTKDLLIPIISDRYDTNYQESKRIVKLYTSYFRYNDLESLIKNISSLIMYVSKNTWTGRNSKFFNTDPDLIDKDILKNINSSRTKIFRELFDNTSLTQSEINKGKEYYLLETNIIRNGIRNLFKSDLKNFRYSKDEIYVQIKSIYDKNSLFFYYMTIIDKKGILMSINREVIFTDKRKNILRMKMNDYLDMQINDKDKLKSMVIDKDYYSNLKRYSLEIKMRQYIV